MRRLALLGTVFACLLGCGSAAAGGSLLIRGGGYGHGIGLSQYGAEGYALHGKDYRFILGHYYRGTALGHVDPAQIVRVLLKTGTVAFSGATQAPGKKLRSDWTYSVRALADGALVLSDPKGKQVGRFPAPLSVHGPGPLLVAGLGSYRGALEFRPDGSGGVQTVDALGLDDYVRGVIAEESFASWPAQALQAQAVAARTYAITTSVAGDGYSLYPDTRSQMYGGVGAETPSTDAAVAATSGQVVTYHGAPVPTFFFASSGGHTENIENVWPAHAPEPWLVGVPDPYDGTADDRYHRWGYDLSLAAAAKRLGSVVKGQLVGIRVLRHGASLRILLASVVGTRGATTVTGSWLQSTFGLLTTYATFTTITTDSGVPASRGERDAWSAVRSLIGSVGLPVAAAPAVCGLRGGVFPAGQGAIVAVQKLGRHGWRTARHLRLDRGGGFSLRLATTGRYRIVYRGLDGPAVRVS